MHSNKPTYCRALLASTLTMVCLLLSACYSNNCPMENTVVCNYHFYDSEGQAISYGDAITVSTPMPGYKTVYIYKRLGTLPMTLNHIDSTLIAQGYTMTVAEQRNDSVLINKLSAASTMSIPMSYFAAADTLVFSYGSISQKDTLFLEKDSYPFVDLPECGTHRFHNIRSIRCTNSAAINNVELEDPRVNYDGLENIKIYFNGVAQ